MKVQAIGHSYNTPSFGVKIGIPGGPDGQEIKKAIKGCPHADILNFELNWLNNAVKYNRDSEGKETENLITLSIIDSFENVPKNCEEPFVGLGKSYHPAPLEEEITDVNTEPTRVLAAKNHTNGVKLCMEFPSDASDEEKSDIMYRFLTSIGDMETRAKTFFWQSLDSNEENNPDEKSNISPEKHNIFFNSWA